MRDHVLADHSPMGSSGLRWTAWAAAYLVAAFAGRLTIVDGGALSLVWPAAGVAGLWLATSSRRQLPADLLGLGAVTVVVNTMTGAPPRLIAVFIVCNLAQALVFRVLVHRWLPGVAGLCPTGADRTAVRPARSVGDLSMLVAAAGGATAVGTFLGWWGLGLVGSPLDLLGVAVWFSRNLAGILQLGALGVLIASVMLGGSSWSGWAARIHHGWTHRRPGAGVEAVLFVGFSVGLYTLIFVYGNGRPLAFLMLFATVLAGARLAPLCVMLHSLLSSVITLYFTLNGHGPFASAGSIRAMVVIAQVFLVLTIVTGLVLAFTRVERDYARRRLQAQHDIADARAALFSTVLDSMHDGVSVVNADGTIVTLNPSAMAMLGLTEQPATVAELIARVGVLNADGTPITSDAAPSSLALNGTPVADADYLIPDPTAPRGYRVVEVTATRVARHGGEGCQKPAVVTFRDVTLERADRTQLATFARMVAHDLITPISVIAGWAQTLADAYDSGSEDVAMKHEIVDRIDSAALQMSSMVNEMLAAAVEQQALVTLRTVDLTALATQVAQIHRGTVPTPHISISPGMRAHADKHLMRQLLDNLIGNAVKYTPPGVRPEISITQYASTSEHTLIAVIDNGIGIDPDDGDKIFENYYRSPHDTDIEGNGLGLAVCKQIVQRHHGHITAFRRTDGPGSIFLIHLPATAPTAGATARQTRHQTAATTTGPRA